MRWLAPLTTALLAESGLGLNLPLDCVRPQARGLFVQKISSWALGEILLAFIVLYGLSFFHSLSVLFSANTDYAL